MKIKSILSFLIISFIGLTGKVYTTESSNIKNLKNHDSNESKDLTIDYFNKFPENDYILGPGDTVKVIVSRDYQELTSITTIDGEGGITLPSLGRIYIEGLTPTEFTNLLNKAYLEYVKFPNVEMEIVEYRPIKVLIEGEINNPGFYTLIGSLSTNNNKFAKIISGDMSLETEQNEQKILSNKLKISAINQAKINSPRISYYFPTVYDAIKKGGGITNLSDLSQISIIRETSLSKGGGKKMATLNFEGLIMQGDNSQNIRIYDGDTIKIAKLTDPNKNNITKAIKYNLNPKFINVYVAGRVKNPGLVSLGKLSTLSDAIDIAGGAKILRGPVKYLTFNNDGSIDKNLIRYKQNRKRGSKLNPFLRDGDLIIVGESVLSNTTELIREITAPFQGIYSTYRLYEAFTD